ncbi:MAG: hypothetical protein K1X88_18330 [Nannocystaceae bacterium]|nr:hypothetical protein [Nannocystaceae bacterium]
MRPQASPSPWGWIALAVAAAAAGVVDDESLAQRAAPAMAAQELAALDRTAGLRDDAGAIVSARPVGVALAVAGPAWAESVAQASVADDAAYDAGAGPHRLAAAFEVLPGAAVVSMQLERRGWTVRAPEPTRRRLRPWLALLPALVALAAWLRGLAPALAVIGAGIAAQLSAALWPWPQPLPPVALREAYASSPALEPLLRAAGGLGELGRALGWGVVVLGVVLAWFDQRRSAQRSSRALVWGVAAVFAAVAWLEAAVRVSTLAWATTAPGVIGLLAIAAVVWLARRGRGVAQGSA